LSMVDHEKRRDHRFDVHEVIRQIIQLFTPFIAGRETVVETQFIEKDVYLFGSYAALESVLVNLFTNSLVAFEKKSLEQRIIRIYTEIVKNPKLKGKTGVEIRVLDNGTGIEGIHMDDIWLPGETTTSNGTGLGLTIVHDTVVQEMGGIVSAIAKNEELGGAELIITLPIL